MTKSTLRQIVELQQKAPAELREMYNQIMPQPCAANANKEFLQPRISYRLQELLYGGLSDEDKGKLVKIANGSSVTAFRKSSMHQSNRLLPGTKICRKWNETQYEVEVLKDGYEYAGQKFRSLSAVATKITGTRWNGLKFFRLKA